MHPQLPKDGYVTFAGLIDQQVVARIFGTKYERVTGS